MADPGRGLVRPAHRSAYPHKNVQAPEKDIRDREAGTRPELLEPQVPTVETGLRIDPDYSPTVEDDSVSQIAGSGDSRWSGFEERARRT